MCCSSTSLVTRSCPLMSKTQWSMNSPKSFARPQKAEASERLIKISTGDGIALVFYTNLEAPVRCAMELSRALKDHPRLGLRMGIHSGPVSGVIDVTGRANLAGAGLNIAQRVMNCGDAGHILLSKHVAEDLEEYEEWRPLLHELGECEVKHGVRVSVVNLYADHLGNPQLPRKFQALKKRSARMRWAGDIVWAGKEYCRPAVRKPERR
jgi:hypothetical protein